MSDNRIEMNIEDLTDEQLSEQLGEAPEKEQSQEPGQEAGDAPESGSSEESAPDAGEEKKKAAEAEPDWKTEVENLRKELNEQKEKTTHWRQVGNRHSDELGRLRQLKERVVAEQKARQQADPMQTFIDDPQKFRQDIVSEVDGRNQMAEIERQERALQMRAQMEQNASFIHQNCPDLKENLDGITKMLEESGDTPQSIAAFRQNPAQFDPQRVMAINYAYRQRKEAEALRAKYESEQGKAERVLSKVEQAAKRKPVSSASGGGKSKSGGIDMDNLDVTSLSDEALAELISKTTL